MQIIQAQRALAFAQQHDWGTGASLGQQRDGAYRVCGLVDAWTQRQPDGAITSGQAYITLPATVAAMREFGGY